MTDALRIAFDALLVVRNNSSVSAHQLELIGPAIEACRAALAEPAVPPGWQLVPVEATEAMCKAAVIYANGNAVYRNVAAEALKIEESIYGEAYAAMLAAAPTAQQEPKP